MFIYSRGFTNYGNTSPVLAQCRLVSDGFGCFGLVLVGFGWFWLAPHTSPMYNESKFRLLCKKHPFARANLDLDGPIWGYLGISGLIWAEMFVFGPIWAYLGFLQAPRDCRVRPQPGLPALLLCKRRPGFISYDLCKRHPFCRHK